MKIFFVIVLWIALFFDLCLYAQTDTVPPATPQGFKAYSYELHVDLVWKPNSENDISAYKIYKWNGTQFLYYTTVPKGKNFLSLFHGSVGIRNMFKISAVDNSGNESALSDSVVTLTHEMTDDEFLDMVQRATFRYFWDYADSNSGLARERYPDDTTCTIGGSGFGVMAILVGINRGFITRQEGIDKILKILDFLLNKADRFHGAFPHWINGTTGKVVPFGEKDDGGDIVETSYMIQGLLTARKFFDGNDEKEIQIRNMITQIWEDVEWDWYSRPPYGTAIYWNWSPNYNFAINLKVQGWNEALIVYLLAIASPTHPVPADLYDKGWAGLSTFVNNNTYYGYKLYVGKPYGGPLFFAHYSFLGFDPRGIRDKYANYFEQNRNHTLINRAYCIANPKKFVGYGENNWGLTASYSIPNVYYLAHEPYFNDNGTIAPTAAISSMPYTPQESIEALKHFYRTYKNKLWGDYGFYDAFNLTYASKDVKGEWFSNGYLAIDEGPIIDMIENYRTGLLWKYFMMNSEIQDALNKIGFVQDSITSVREKKSIIPGEFKLEQNYPNPFNPTTVISYQLPVDSYVTLNVYDMLGSKVTTLVNEEKSPGSYSVQFSASDYKLSSGVYFYRLTANNFSITRKMIYLK
ncbi:glucoamylase family protein [Melioribacteraceae bacterium 4301-Me]|uniref:glucoamylase family protein n=1 Tax=Pyranulibacter aquaticus TaxID=3163344 RepID=UPI00359BF2D5